MSSLIVTELLHTLLGNYHQGQAALHTLQGLVEFMASAAQDNHRDGAAVSEPLERLRTLPEGTEITPPEPVSSPTIDTLTLGMFCRLPVWIFF
jgi:hypothetical protein